MVPTLLRTLSQPWVAAFFFLLLATLCLLSAGYEVRNYSDSPTARRYVVLAVVSLVVAGLLYVMSRTHH